MISPDDKPEVEDREARRRRLLARAFSLVEIGVVVFIISLICSIAVPQFKKSIIATRSEAVINDLRVFSAAFQQYAHDKGEWPQESSTPGVLPAGMESYLKESSWTKPTPIGGYYTWQYMSVQNGVHVRAILQISSGSSSEVSPDAIQLEDIDRRIDDGNLDTGGFRLGYAYEPLWVIEQ